MNDRVMISWSCYENPQDSSYTPPLSRFVCLFSSTVFPTVSPQLFLSLSSSVSPLYSSLSLSPRLSRSFSLTLYEIAIIAKTMMAVIIATFACTKDHENREKDMIILGQISSIMNIILFCENRKRHYPRHCRNTCIIFTKNSRRSQSSRIPRTSQTSRTSYTRSSPRSHWRWPFLKVFELPKYGEYTYMSYNTVVAWLARGHELAQKSVSVLPQHYFFSFASKRLWHKILDLCFFSIKRLPRSLIHALTPFFNINSYSVRYSNSEFTQRSKLSVVRSHPTACCPRPPPPPPMSHAFKHTVYSIQHACI